MTVSSTGTGTISLNASVPGFNTFDLAGCSTAATGQIIDYGINDTSNTECATGTYYSSSVQLTRGSSLSGMVSTNGNSAIVMSLAAQVFITPTAITYSPPTFQTLTGGTGFTYVTPNGVTWLRIRACGSGGGGGASIANGGGGGGTGGLTSFDNAGSNFTANSGLGGSGGGVGSGGSGGTGGFGSVFFRAIGDGGGCGGGVAETTSGYGGGSAFFGGGGKAFAGNSTGQNGAVNTGGGGSGGAGIIAGDLGGSGGGGGECFELIIQYPLASYLYSVGLGGSGGGSGSGSGGGFGGSGIIVIEEHYN
jgi:hypothetical protein